MQRPEDQAHDARRQRCIEAAVFLAAALLYGLGLLWPLLALEGEVGTPVAVESSSVDDGSQAGDGTQTADGAPTVRFLTPPRWLLPVDDPYIFIRFAQQISRGRLYQWTDGEVSTGASSLIYPWLLLPAQWLFPDVAGWSRWSNAVGILCLWALALAAAGLLRRVGLPWPWPMMAGLSLIFCGPIAWVSVAGMDSALGCAALLWTCCLWSDASGHRDGSSVGSSVGSGTAGSAAGTMGPRRPAGLLLLLAFLPWIRPDFALVTGLAAVAVLLGKGPAVSRWWGPLLLTPGLLWMALNALLTGQASPAGVLAKSALSSPFVSWGYGLEIIVSLVRQNLLGVYAGLQPTILPPPVGGLAILTALAVLMVWVGWRPFQRALPAQSVVLLRALGPLAMAWACAVLSTCFSGYMSWQYYRHHHPGLACAWVLAWAGAYLLLRALARSPMLQRLWPATATPGAAIRRRRLGNALLLCLPLLLLSRASDWSYAYFRSTVQFYQDNGFIADWLRHNLRQEVLLVHDAGLLVLAHDGPSLDIMGLGTPSFALPHRDGAGAVIEQLARHRPLPTYAAGLDRLLRLRGLLGPPLVVAPSRRYLSDGMYVAPLRREVLAKTALPGLGVDFGHAESEAEVPLRWDPVPRSLHASFALAYRTVDGRVTMQGCRPLRHALTIPLPAGDTETAGSAEAAAGRRIVLRWAPQPGHSGEILLRLAPAETGDTSVEARLDADTGRWAETTVPWPTEASRLYIENVGDGEPCLESVAFCQSP